jgi:tetratricopeptide (TPR) repeat protein
VGLFAGILGGRSLEAYLRRARASLAAGELDKALEAVTDGLEKFPDATVLRDTGHAVRRAQARAGIKALRDRIEEEGDAQAYEELIALYKDVGMAEEAARLAQRYAEARPDSAAPHLICGEHALEAFFADLRARDGHVAIDHLLRAGALNPDSLKSRLFLAEIYYAIGADRALLGQATAIERLACDDEVLKPVVAALMEAAKPVKNESVDALLAKVEVDGALARDPSTWSSRRRLGIGGERDAVRVQRGLERLWRDGFVEEAVAIDRAGAVVAEAGAKPAAEAAAGEGAEEKSEAPVVETALAGVGRAVARTIKVQARELEMGRFRRFVVEGPFGVMVVEDAAGGVVAARGKRGSDPLRLAERLAVAVEGGKRKAASAA